MEFSGENILIILLVGLVIGLLPSMFVERTRGGFVRDVACGIGGIVVAALLTLAWRDDRRSSLWPTKSAKDESANLAPPYEPVVLPLSPLRPLLKPVIYRSREEICDALARATRSNDLPAHFFIRLLYQESNFRLAAISSAGALGIAQFMPETASDRGLDNPFDALQAIPASARLLRDLYLKFGNLGLAAAAYNAGPQTYCGLAREQGSVAAGNARLRQGHHGLAGGGVDRCSNGQPGSQASARGALPGIRRPACVEWAGRNPVAAAKSSCARKLRIRQRLSRSPPNRAPMRRLKRAKRPVR